MTTFNYTAPVAFQPIVPGSVTFSVPGFTNVTDNGVGGCAAGNGVSSCTINYAAGTVQIVTLAAAANGSTISGWFIGGASSGDQTQSVALTNFSTAQNLYINPMIGPVAILGKPIYGNPINAIAIFGDSINEGAGNTAGQTDTGWLDYSGRAGAFGVYKAAASGLQLGEDSTLYGRIGRITALNGAGVDRVINNAATNDFASPGKSLSQVVNYFLNARPALAGVVPRGARDLWWVAMFPRTVSNVSNAPVVVSSGPYTAAGAAFGSGVVVSPTPLGGIFGSGVIGNGILSCTITGTGSAGPYSCNFGVVTMIGSLWSDATYSTVIDTGAGGTSATTLTGSLVSTGTHTPSTGAVSVTFSSALASGKTVNLYAFASGPSARNAWNYFLYNYAVPTGLIGGVIDPNAVIEASPASATGAGSGQWSSLSYTADGTHPSPAAHQTVLPGYLGPTGTNPSAVWTLN